MARVDGGDELTRRNDKCILGGGDVEWPIEMTLNGRAREINCRRVASAGAVLWMIDGRAGRMRMVGRAVIGLLGEAHAQVAEAYGCRVGPRMLMDMQPGTGAARVAGENLNVVRCCASEGRIKRLHIQELLEGPQGAHAGLLRG